VQIEEGLQGLVHISELSPEPVKKPSDVAKIGDELMVRIIDIDFDKRRMAFSVKQVENPVEDKEEEKRVKDSKSEKKSEKKEVLDKESNKKRQIKEILKEMKKEADIE